MTCSTAAFYKSHNQLIQWQDELEYLCYILCELLCPYEIEKKGFKCHQAADLPNLIEIIRSCCDQTSHGLQGFLTYQEVGELKVALNEAKVVRNAAAHHVVLTRNVMRSKRGAVERAESKLELLIKSVAASRNIDQVTFS